MRKFLYIELHQKQAFFGVDIYVHECLYSKTASCPHRKMSQKKRRKQSAQAYKNNGQGQL